MTTLPTISLFSGIGGLDLGLERSGFQVRLCVESDPHCRVSLEKQRRPQAEHGDICKLSPVEASKHSGLKPGELALLAGGPPCQPFSKARQWTGKIPLMSDPLASTTIKSFMDYVEYFLPEAVLLENVSGFGMEGSAFSYLSQRFEQLNENRGTLYTLNVWRLNAANYGVPQARQRYFVVTHRGGQLLAPPLATHGNEKCLKPLSTAWDAIWKYNDIFDNDDSLKPRGTWGALLPSIPEGSNYLFHTPKGEGRPLFGYRTRYWSFLLKLAKNRPSWTLLSSPGSATGPFHWKSRMLAIPEMLCLQSFSEKHPVSEDYYKARRQIGNAVPPLLAEVLGRHIAKTLFNEEILGSPKYLRKRKQPAPEPVQEVPEYYLTQEGDHQDHPGAGKGPAAHKNALEEESPG